MRLKFSLQNSRAERLAEPHSYEERLINADPLDTIYFTYLRPNRKNWNIPLQR